MPGMQRFDAITIAAGSGEGFLIVAVVLILVGAGIGLYSREGSEIDTHPRGSERGDTAGSDDS